MTRESSDIDLAFRRAGYCYFWSLVLANQLLARAVEVAASAHATQVDKGGAPCVLHPLRMMLEAGEGPDARGAP